MSKGLLRKSLEFVDPDCFIKGKQLGKKQPGAGKRKRAGKKQKQSIDSLREELQSNSADRTEENLCRLRQLSSASTIDSATTNKILERAGKRSQKPKKEEVPKEEKTAFTEDDFAKFEREYFVSK